MHKDLIPAALLAVLSVLVSPSGGDGTGAVLQWPVREKKGVTSSFGEWRPGHVHAGVDVKTWGRVGVPLLAVDDGYISRVRTSPWGYGISLYLRLNDGRTAVYGHMDRFTPEIEELVRDRQQAEVRYTVDIWLEEGEFTVSRGDIVGYSGITATTAPHLHFELRDSRNYPLNPLRNGLEIVDTTPPVVQFLLFRPVGSESRLEDEVRVRRFGLRSAGGNTYRLRGRPEFHGSVGIGVAAYDRMDDVWNRFSPYRLLLEVDGENVFEVRYDSFSYDHSEQIVLDRDYRYMIREGVRAHTLYRREGNELTFYGSYGEGEGYIENLAPGVHELRVTVADANGNESIVEGEILCNRPPGISLSADKGGEPGETIIAGSLSDPDGDEVELSVDVLPIDRATVNPDTALSDITLTSEPEQWRRVPVEPFMLGGGEFRITRAILDSLTADISPGTSPGTSPGMSSGTSPGTSPRISQAIDPESGSRYAGGYLVRVKAVDEWGSEVGSAPLPLGEVPAFDAGRLSLMVDRYEDFLLLSARPENRVPGGVVFTVRQGALPPVTLEGVRNGNSGNGGFEASYHLQISGGERIEVSATFEPVTGRASEASVTGRYISLPATERSGFVSRTTGLSVEFPPGTFYEDAWIEEAPSTLAEGIAEQELVPLTLVCNLGPQDILFRGNGELSMQVENLPDFVEPRQVGLYTHDGQDESADEEDQRRWFYLGGELNGNTLNAQIGGFGPFAVMADTSRPQLRLLSPRDGSAFSTGRPRIAFEIDDLATGISEETQIVLRLNGAQVVAQYDPMRDRLVYVPAEPLEPGDYWLRLEVTDNAGNIGRIESRFAIR